MNGPHTAHTERWVEGQGDFLETGFQDLELDPIGSLEPVTVGVQFDAEVVGLKLKSGGELAGMRQRNPKPHQE